MAGVVCAGGASATGAGDAKSTGESAAGAAVGAGDASGAESGGARLGVGAASTEEFAAPVASDDESFSFAALGDSLGFGAGGSGFGGLGMISTIWSLRTIAKP